MDAARWDFIPYRRCDVGAGLNDAPFVIRAQSKLAHTPCRHAVSAALEVLAKILGAPAGDITVHILDLDWLFVDWASPPHWDTAKSPRSVL